MDQKSIVRSGDKKFKNGKYRVWSSSICHTNQVDISSACNWRTFCSHSCQLFCSKWANLAAPTADCSRVGHGVCSISTTLLDGPLWNHERISSGKGGGPSLIAAGEISPFGTKNSYVMEARVGQFLPFCGTCGQSRLTSSSNRNLNFDYCTRCKQTQTFVAEQRAGSQAKGPVERLGGKVAKE